MANVLDTRLVNSPTVTSVAPPAIVTEGGIGAIVGFELVRSITAPPGGAAASSLTVMNVCWPPLTLPGLNLMLSRFAAMICKSAVSEILFAVAVIVAVVDSGTARVETVNVADELP